MALTQLPLVGVSACLLGQPVRYDGKDKYTALICEELKKHCRLLAVCPEVEIGLGIPRKKIQLTLKGTEIRVIQKTEDNRDVTSHLQGFAIQFIEQYELAGLVLQDKSPSCGVENTQLYSMSGEKIGLDSGLFAATVIEKAAYIEIIQASQLQSKRDVMAFVSKLI